MGCGREGGGYWSRVPETKDVGVSERSMGIDKQWADETTGERKQTDNRQETHAKRNKAGCGDRTSTDIQDVEKGVCTEQEAAGIRAEAVRPRCKGGGGVRAGRQKRVFDWGRAEDEEEVEGHEDEASSPEGLRELRVLLGDGRSGASEGTRGVRSEGVV